MTSVNRQLPLYYIRNLTPVAVVVEDIATREEQEDLANVLTFIKLRRKSNPNKRLYLLIYDIGLSGV
jgi:hypothetical protein